MGCKQLIALFPVAINHFLRAIPYDTINDCAVMMSLSIRGRGRLLPHYALKEKFWSKSTKPDTAI